MPVWPNRNFSAALLSDEKQHHGDDEIFHCLTTTPYGVTMRYFTVGETWGPFTCEHAGCAQQTFTLALTDEENILLPESSGPAATAFIFNHQLGVAVCDEHRQKPKTNATTITETSMTGVGTKFTLRDADDLEIGHAYLYLLRNDLHQQPFGLLEDLFVDETARGQGYGTRLVHAVVRTAQAKRCYKLIATSRYDRVRVHRLYQALGFQQTGHEFRLDLSIP